MTNFNVTLTDARKAFEKDEYDAAISAYSMADGHVTLAPNDLRKYAFSLFENSEYERAILLLRRWEQSEPRSPVLYSMLSHALKNVGRLEEAISALEKSLCLKVRPSGYCVLGSLLVEGGRTDEAKVAYAKALKLDSEYEEAKENLRRLEKTKGLRRGQQLS